MEEVENVEKIKIDYCVDSLAKKGKLVFVFPLTWASWDASNQAMSCIFSREIIWFVALYVLESAVESHVLLSERLFPPPAIAIPHATKF